MSVYAEERSILLPAPQSAYAAPQLAAYALGATMWTPALFVIARMAMAALAWIMPELPAADGFGLIAALWTLRFALYVLGARGCWDYGYGINGVIVSRRLRLADKVRRIATDWFGVVLLLVWLGAAVWLVA